MDAVILEQMRNVDIRAVDPAMLVDINDVYVDQDLPRRERIREFVRQIGNPYCFRVGKIAVKVNYARNGVTLDDRLESMLVKL